MSGEFLIGEFQAIPKRGLEVETCRKFGYKVGKDRSGKSVQIAEYRDPSGSLIAQKLRYPDKQFPVLGETKLPLWGQHLWPTTGRRVVVTEGEVDCMSVAQAAGLSWPVVSIPFGAGKQTKKSIMAALEWLCGYEQVVLAWDMDDAGRAAAAECAPLFPPGKCALWEIPLKDANEMLVAGKVKEIASALWNARVYRPGGIISGADVWDRITKRSQPGVSYPWEGLTKMSYGQRKGSLVTWTSGTGMGKSTAVGQVAYDLAFKKGLRVGYVALEEDVGRAAQRFLSCHLEKPVHLEGAVTNEELRTAFDETLAKGNIWLYDHFGSTDSDDLINKLRYLAKGCNCDCLVLDHLSIAVSGMDLGTDERRQIDQTMTRLRTLVEETGVLMHVISHIRKGGNDQTSAEEGGRVSLSQLRGSAAIAQLSDQVIALERNMQSGDNSNTIIRVLKNRLSGDTGVACRLHYNKVSGLLEEVPEGAKHGFGDESNSDF